MDVKSIISQMTLEEKAALCSVKTSGISILRSASALNPSWSPDGPCGIRKQSDAADHLGLNASVPATSYPIAAPAWRAHSTASCPAAR